MTLSGEAFEAIVEAVVERLRADHGSSPWLTRVAADEYLGVPVTQLEKDRRVPSHGLGEGRGMHHRDEFDEYLLRGSERVLLAPSARLGPVPAA